MKGRSHLRYIRITAPDKYGQPDHEESQRAKVGRDGEVAVERRRAHLALEVGQIGCLPAHEGQESLSKRVSPSWQRAFVWPGRLSAFELKPQGAGGAIDVAIGLNWR
jgi:hypothetical protein